MTLSSRQPLRPNVVFLGSGSGVLSLESEKEVGSYNFRQIAANFEHIHGCTQFQLCA